ncbi:MAG: hypothetical protein WAW23_02380 [Candidatus Methanoperedens sp.]
MVPAKTVSVGNSTALPKGVIQHVPDALTGIVSAVFRSAQQNQAKAPETTPAKKRYSGCKNN